MSSPRVVAVTPDSPAERAGLRPGDELVALNGEAPRDIIRYRVLADEGFDEATRAFARDLAEGPTKAHAATKAIVRGYLEGGVARADELVPEIAGGLFATEDLQQAVKTFLEQGPGHATFAGR